MRKIWSDKWAEYGRIWARIGMDEVKRQERDIGEECEFGKRKM